MTSRTTDRDLLSLFPEPQPLAPGTVFFVGKTRLRFEIVKIDGNKCVVRGESGRKSVLPREDVERRLTCR